MAETPFEQIKKSLSKEIPSDLIGNIPNKWKKIGDVLIIKIPNVLIKFKKEIGKQYATVLDCKTVLNDVSGISGIYRTPNVGVIYGPKNTETIHKENGIRFKLNPQKVMFSSGNMDERIRMAKISNKKETVVDLFAGIGYFTIPIAVYSKPKKIFACEINTISYEYLCNNISLNHVTEIVEPLLGDNKEIAPKNVADRVVMGYIRDTPKFLQIAMSCLKDHTGIIHYHDVFPDDVIPKKPFTFIQKAAEQYNSDVELMTFKKIKSYAPGVSHVVLDVKIGE
jgi:tRNA wybutosine-synthesizing protein 2